MKKLFLSLILVALAGCEADAVTNVHVDIPVDTVEVVLTDTLTLPAITDTLIVTDTLPGTVDTVTVTVTDTLPAIIDTVFVTDTLPVQVDTLIVVDTLPPVTDTLLVTDTLFVTDTLPPVVDTLVVTDSVLVTDTLTLTDTLSVTDTLFVTDTLPPVVDTLFVTDTLPAVTDTLIVRPKKDSVTYALEGYITDDEWLRTTLGAFSVPPHDGPVEVWVKVELSGKHQKDEAFVLLKDGVPISDYACPVNPDNPTFGTDWVRVGTVDDGGEISAQHAKLWSCYPPNHAFFTPNSVWFKQLKFVYVEP